MFLFGWKKYFPMAFKLLMFGIFQEVKCRTHDVTSCIPMRFDTSMVQSHKSEHIQDTYKEQYSNHHLDRSCVVWLWPKLMQAIILHSVMRKCVYTAHKIKINAFTKCNVFVDVVDTVSDSTWYLKDHMYADIPGRQYKQVCFVTQMSDLNMSLVLQLM